MRAAWRRGWPALLAAVLLASGCGSHSGTSAGESGRTAGGTGAVTPPGGASASSSSGTAGGAVAGTSAVNSPTGTPSQTALARSVPVSLQIPAIGVDTPLMSLGLAADHTVEVPPIQAHSPAGWYDGSPTPGQTGPSVILGHVTVGQYGDGVFRHLDQLHPGARVTVRLQDGAAADFTVDSVRTVAKDQFPTQQVYGNVNRPELRLITCGGPRTGDGYQDNVVVFASLAGTAG